MRIRVLLVSRLEEKLNQLRAQLNDDDIVVIGTADSNTDTLSAVEAQDPDMVIFGLTENDQASLNLAERIITYRPKCFVVLVADEMNMKLMQSAVTIGAHNVTAITENPKELVDFTKNVYHNETLRLRAMSEHQEVTWSSQVITVFSPKGGMGKTSVAVNIAAALAEIGKKVAIVDLDLQFGDVPTFMDIEPKDTISELVQESVSPTIDMLRSYMFMHASGVHVLCAPKSPEYAEMIPAKQVQTILSVLRAYYDFVIVDTASVLNDITMSAIDLSSHIFFLAGLDLSSLKNACLAMNLFESLQLSEKVTLIVNRNDENSSIEIEDVERVLGLKVTSILPTEHNTALGALNKGIPFVINAPTSELSIGVKTLARSLLSEDEQLTKKELRKKLRAEVKQNKVEAKQRAAADRKAAAATDENDKKGLFHRNNKRGTEQ